MKAADWILQSINPRKPEKFLGRKAEDRYVTFGQQVDDLLLAYPARLTARGWMADVSREARVDSSAAPQLVTGLVAGIAGDGGKLLSGVRQLRGLRQLGSLRGPYAMESIAALLFAVALLEGRDEMYEDYERVKEEVMDEWRSGKRRQSWTLVPKAKLVRLYRGYAKYGRLDEQTLLDVWTILHDCVLKVLYNSEVRDGYHAADELFELGDYGDPEANRVQTKTDAMQPEFHLGDPREKVYKKPTEDQLEKQRDKLFDRWFYFVSDGSGSIYVRNFGEKNGNARYSDGSRALSNLLSAAYSAQTDEARLLAIDRLLNFAHGLGAMAGWFVEGGVKTLDEIAEWAPQGMTAAGFR